MIIPTLSSKELGIPVGASAVTSPWWLDSLTMVSDTVALWLPILGALLLLLQIGGWIYDRFWK